MRTARFESIALQPGALLRHVQVTQAVDEPLPKRFRHFHALAELLLFADGAGTCFGEAGAVQFGPRTALFVPPMAIHDLDFAAGPGRWTLLQFDAQTVDPERVLLPRQTTVAALGLRNEARVHVLLEWLSDLTATTPQAIEAGVILRSLLLALKADFAAAGALANSASHRQGRLRPFLQHALDHPNRVLSLNEAATLCRLSAPYFSKLFKEAFGCGFNAYQNQSRLQHAARLLATSQDPVSQIGYSVGFQSHAHFSKRFKTQFGMSPNRFQKTQQNRFSEEPIRG